MPACVTDPDNKTHYNYFHVSRWTYKARLAMLEDWKTEHNNKDLHMLEDTSIYNYAGRYLYISCMHWKTAKKTAKKSTRAAACYC